jgi:glycosyltransferase involved in cell wall biosynthesis
MSGSTPVISIVLPVHNGGAYLAAALDSLFAQTYLHFNVLVLENQSDDTTPELLRSVQDSRLQVFPSDRLLSIEENWARIADLPLAEWMTIISHDDLLYPDFLSAMVALIQAEPEASLYTSHFDMIDAEGKTIRPSRPAPYRESGDAFLERRLLWQADSFGTGYVLRSEDYQRAGGIPLYPGLFYADDVLWGETGNLKARICSPQRLFAYRYYRSSTARKIDLSGLYDASIQFLDYLETRPYFQDEAHRALAQSYVARHLNRNYQRLLVNLITECQPEQMTAYRQMKNELLARARRDGRFPVYNTVLRLIEQIRWIPFRWGRAGVLRLMENAAIWLRGFTDADRKRDSG